MYCTATDITAFILDSQLVELTDGGSGSVNTGYVEEAIKRADSLIDSYLCSRYDVPFVNVPQVIKYISCVLSIYFLYERSGHGEIEPKRKDAYMDQMNLLRAIASGEISLVGKASEGLTTASDREFTKETLRGF